MKIPLVLVVLAILLAFRLSAFAEESQLRIAVRSEVDRPFQGWRKAPLKEHGKLYYLASIKDGISEEGGIAAKPLLRPVDEDRLRKVLVAELGKCGFRAIRPGMEPEIVLTVIYGRGFLRNPYYAGQMFNETADVPTVTLDGIQANDSIGASRSPIYQARLQNAQLEKLFVRVTAWSYPGMQIYPDPDKRKRPRVLWKTTVLIDEPARRDLNQFVGKMLAAASPYFDHPIQDEEAFVNTKFPEGYVEVGEPTEVPDRKSDNADSK